MKLNKILIMFITLFLVLGMTIVYAQETDTSTQVKEDAKVITPESSLYGLNNAFQRISLALTFNKAKKAQKELGYAREKLLAAKQLVEANKFEDLARLKEEHKKLLEDVKTNLDQVSQENPDQAIDNQAQIEKQVDEQQNKLEEVSNNVDLKVVGKLNDDQLAKLKDFLNSLDNNIGDVKVKLNNNEDKVKLKLKAMGKTDKEIEDKLKEIKETHKLGEFKKEIAQKEVERLQNKLEKLKEITQKHKDRGKDVTEMEQRLKDVQDVIDQIKTNLQNNDTEKIRELVKKAEQLLNFREVFRALEGNDNAKLTELNKLRVEKLSEIKKDFMGLEEIKKEIKDERQANKEQIKTKIEAEREAKKEPTTSTGTTENSKPEETKPTTSS